jgi:hypothetical protein
MSDAFAPPPSEPAKEYSSDLDGIKAVARDLEDERRKRRGDADGDPVPRNYVQIGGDDHGQPASENETISLERAATDLSRQRAIEAASQEPMQVEVAAGIDQVRANYAQSQQPQPQQAEFNQTQAQTEQQPDIDPEIQQALSNPKVRAALEAEVNSAESARVQYAQATAQAAQLAGASLLASFPELASVPANQLQTAIQVIGVRDPQRAQAINAQLERVQALLSASQQAQHAQAQIQAQRAATQQQQLQAWVAAEEQKFDREVLAKENPETVKKIKEALPQILTEDYGISREDLAHAVQTNPILRSAAFSSVLLDAAKYKLAQRDAAAKVSRPVPPVQKPGVASNRFANDGVEAALKAFRQNPGPETGAALVAARRAASR